MKTTWQRGSGVMHQGWRDAEVACKGGKGDRTPVGMSLAGLDTLSEHDKRATEKRVLRVDNETER